MCSWNKFLSYSWSMDILQFSDTTFIIQIRNYYFLSFARLARPKRPPCAAALFPPLPHRHGRLRRLWRRLTALGGSLERWETAADRGFRRRHYGLTDRVQGEGGGRGQGAAEMMAESRRPVGGPARPTRCLSRHCAGRNGRSRPPAGRQEYIPEILWKRQREIWSVWDGERDREFGREGGREGGEREGIQRRDGESEVEWRAVTVRGRYLLLGAAVN